MAKKNGTPIAPPTLIGTIQKEIRPDSTEFLVIGESRKRPGTYAFGVTTNVQNVAMMVIGFVQTLSPAMQRHIIANLPDAAPEKTILELNQ